MAVPSCTALGAVSVRALDSFSAHKFLESAGGSQVRRSSSEQFRRRGAIPAASFFAASSPLASRDDELQLEEDTHHRSADNPKAIVTSRRRVQTRSETHSWSRWTSSAGRRAASQLGSCCTSQLSCDKHLIECVLSIRLLFSTESSRLDSDQHQHYYEDIASERSRRSGRTAVPARSCARTGWVSRYSTRLSLCFGTRMSRRSAGTTDTGGRDSWRGPLFMRAGFACSLVCKAWVPLGLALLFEHVSVPPGISTIPRDCPTGHGWRRRTRSRRARWAKRHSVSRCASMANTYGV